VLAPDSQPEAPCASARAPGLGRRRRVQSCERVEGTRSRSNARCPRLRRSGASRRGGRPPPHRDQLALARRRRRDTANRDEITSSARADVFVDAVRASPGITNCDTSPSHGVRWTGVSHGPDAAVGHMNSCLTQGCDERVFDPLLNMQAEPSRSKIGDVGLARAGTGDRTGTGDTDPSHRLRARVSSYSLRESAMVDRPVQVYPAPGNLQTRLVNEPLVPGYVPAGPCGVDQLGVNLSPTGRS
jgi:hypothetical protein